jgi:hypothetical protein
MIPELSATSCGTDPQSARVECLPFLNFKRYEQTFAIARQQIIELICCPDTFDPEIRELALHVFRQDPADFFQHAMPGFEEHYVSLEHINFYLGMLLETYMMGNLRYVLSLEPFLCFPVNLDTTELLQTKINQKLRLLAVEEEPDYIYILQDVADFILLCDVNHMFYHLDPAVVDAAFKRVTELEYTCNAYCVTAGNGHSLETVRSEEPVPSEPGTRGPEGYDATTNPVVLDGPMAKDEAARVEFLPWRP